MLINTNQTLGSSGSIVPVEPIIIDADVTIVRPQGAGIAVDEDALNFEDFLKSMDIEFTQIEDYIILYGFNNDLPYYAADCSLNFFNRKTGKVIRTKEIHCIQFSEYKIFMVEGIEDVVKLNHPVFYIPQTKKLLGGAA